MCTSGQPWNYGDWLFTARPGVFGLIPGMANPAGVGLIIILTIMVVCALPMVRRSGYFQVSFKRQRLRDETNVMFRSIGFLLYSFALLALHGFADYSCPCILEMGDCSICHLFGGKNLQSFVDYHGTRKKFCHQSKNFAFKVCNSRDFQSFIHSNIWFNHWFNRMKSMPKS